MSPEEAWPLVCHGSTLYYRRLSLGVLASLERQHSVTLPAGEHGAPPRRTVDRHALEAAICAHVLVGWQGVLDHQGQAVEFTPSAGLKLPAGVRNRLLAVAMDLNPPAADRDDGAGAAPDCEA